MQRHFVIVAAMYIAIGALNLMALAVIFAIIAAVDLNYSYEPNTQMVLRIAALVAGILSLISVSSMISGFGLYYQKSWAKLPSLIIAVILLPGIPLSTAIGIYALWTLTHVEVAANSTV